jgi:hypothetical protein
MKRYLVAAIALTIPWTTSQAMEKSSWEFSIEPYGWLTALDGNVGALGRTASVEAGFDDIWNVLNFAAAMRAEARNGRLGIIADGFFADLSQSFTPPTRLHNHGQLDMRQFIGELDLAWRLKDTPEAFLDAYAGIRYNDMSNELSARAARPPIRDINLSQDKSWTDPIVGLRGQWNFREKWFLAGRGDIGGFDTASELTWSLQATVGHHFTESVSAELGYRLMETDYRDGGFTYDVSQAGLYMGMTMYF